MVRPTKHQMCTLHKAEECWLEAKEVSLVKDKEDGLQLNEALAAIEGFEDLVEWLLGLWFASRVIALPVMQHRI